MKQKETIIKVLTYIKKYWFVVILSLFLAALTVISTLYIPILTGDAVDLIVDKGTVRMHLIIIGCNIRKLIFQVRME